MSDASEDRIRFQVELEFVQCLGNPNYLNFLAQRGYFKDQAFVNYLKYLLYWKEPQYAHFLKYPMCLYFLDQLQYEHFRRELASAQCAKFIDDQQVLLWQHYTKRRTRLLQEHAETPSNNTAASNANNSNTATVPVSTSSTTSNNNTSSNSNSCSSSSNNSNSNTSSASNTTTNSTPRPQQTNGQSSQNPT